MFPLFSGNVNFENACEGQIENLLRLDKLDFCVTERDKHKLQETLVIMHILVPVYKICNAYLISYVWENSVCTGKCKSITSS